MTNVMIIEDNASMRDLLSTLLHLEGFLVTAPLPNLDEIKSSYLETKPEIIIMDYYLPQFTARQAIQMLQKTGFSLPKIIITSGENLQYESVETGASCFLMKPFSPSELIERLHDLSREAAA